LGATALTAVAALAAALLVLLAELLQLLLLRGGQDGLHVAHGGLLVLAQLVADRLALLAQLAELLALLLGELLALAALAALPLRLVILALALRLPGPALPLAALGAEVRKAALLEERAHPLLERTVLALQALLDALQARHLVAGQVQLVLAGDQPLDAAAALAALLPATALMLPMPFVLPGRGRLRLLRGHDGGRAGERQRGRERTDLHLRLPLLHRVVMQPHIRLRYNELHPALRQRWLAGD
jgi:hypothetical protein